MKQEVYETLHDYLSVVEAGGYTRYQSEEGAESFTGTANLKEALTIAKEGIELEAMDLRLQAVEQDVVQYRNDYVWDVSGAVVDIGRYMNGEPECMVDQPLTPDSKFKTIVVDMTQSGSVNKKVFVNKAIGIAHMIDKLESEGTRVELTIVCLVEPAGGVKEQLRLMVKIKGHHERLSISQLTGVLHPGFFRRVTFGWIEKMVKRNPTGYGLPAQTIGVFEGGLTGLGVDVKTAVLLPNQWVASAYGFSGNLNELEQVERYLNYFLDASNRGEQE